MHLIHRGIVNKKYKENLLKSFNQSFKKGYGIETDIHVTKDDQFICFIETFEGPSFWGHERLYLPDEERMKFRNKRMETAAEGKQAPLLIDCPWLYTNIKNKK